MVVRVLGVGGENDDMESAVRVVSTAHTAADVGVLQPNVDSVPMEVEEEIEEPEEIEPPPAAVLFSGLFLCADGLDWGLMVIGSFAKIVQVLGKCSLCLREWRTNLTSGKYLWILYTTYAVAAVRPWK